MCSANLCRARPLQDLQLLFYGRIISTSEVIVIPFANVVPTILVSTIVVTELRATGGEGISSQDQKMRTESERHIPSRNMCRIEVLP